GNAIHCVDRTDLMLEDDSLRDREVHHQIVDFHERGRGLRVRNGRRGIGRHLPLSSRIHSVPDTPSTELLGRLAGASPLGRRPKVSRGRRLNCWLLPHTCQGDEPLLCCPLLLCRVRDIHPTEGMVPGANLHRWGIGLALRQYKGTAWLEGTSLDGVELVRR